MLAFSNSHGLGAPVTLFTKVLCISFLFHAHIFYVVLYMTFLGTMRTNIYLSQIEHQRQNKDVIPPKDSLVNQRVYWVTYRNMVGEILIVLR